MKTTTCSLDSKIQRLERWLRSPLRKSTTSVRVFWQKKKWGRSWLESGEGEAEGEGEVQDNKFSKNRAFVNGDYTSRYPFFRFTPWILFYLTVLAFLMEAFNHFFYLPWNMTENAGIWMKTHLQLPFSSLHLKSLCCFCSLQCLFSLSPPLNLQPWLIQSWVIHHKFVSRNIKSLL